VAALTWQIGRAAPPGVTVNALSPIAATRMVAAALARQAESGNTSGRSAASGGVSLGAGVPPPEHLGPIGAYLASDAFAWSNGQVMFSNGAEVAWVAPPRLLEVALTTGDVSLPALLDALVPAVLVPAEAAQASNGGGNPRVGASGDQASDGAGGTGAAGRVVVVTDSAAWGAALADAFARRGVECVGIGAWQGDRPGPAEPATGFAPVADQLAAVARDAGPVAGVVVALAGAPAGAGGAGWEHILADHTGITDRIRSDASWVRAVSDHSAASGAPLRVVQLIDATSPGGWSRAQAATQLSRAAHGATDDRVDAFTISVESDGDPARAAAAEAAAFLVGTAAAGALSGAELVAGPDWIGLRSHPYPSGTVTYGGPDIPESLDHALRSVVSGLPSAP
jgi:hypothetical protein